MSRPFEKQFNEYLTKLIYASFADIEVGWNDPIKHSPNCYQSYENLCKDKKDRGDGLKSRFTVAPQVQQFLAFLFAKMIEELKDIPIDPADTIETIRGKLADTYTESYTDFMYQVAAKYKANFGERLKSASDPTRYFHNQIIGLLPTCAGGSLIISALLSTEFDGFLKSLSWLFGNLLWYYEIPVNEKLFLGTLAQQGMPQIMIDLLRSCLRARAPAKPRVGAVKKGADSPQSPTDTIEDNEFNDLLAAV